MRINCTLHVGIVVKELALLTRILSKLAIGFDFFAAEFPGVGNNTHNACPDRDKTNRYEQE